MIETFLELLRENATERNEKDMAFAFELGELNILPVWFLQDELVLSKMLKQLFEDSNDKKIMVEYYSKRINDIKKELAKRVDDATRSQPSLGI